jgi:NADH dehydrogenase [ubiquinone] 1 alpha subcomplex assembly factor 7
LNRFPKFKERLGGIHMVENSSNLRSVQTKLLCGTVDSVALNEATTYTATTHTYNIPITWYYGIKDIEKRTDSMSIVIAHEFFDALPVHVLEVKPKQQSDCD